MEKEMLKKSGSSILITIGIITGAIVYENNGNIHSGYEIKNYIQVEEKKDYTVMIYMDGSNLESVDGAATEDIKEIINSYPKDSSLNIVIEAGGASDWYTKELEGKGNTRFLIGDSGIKNSQKIEEKNMGVYDTLADFMNYGIQSYPAEKYILIFWDHGGGSINGFGNDELFGGDSLELSEIDEAFEKSVAKDTSFELIGFDACIMGNLETANILKDRGSYMIASEDLEPEEGWNYEWLLKLNNKNLTGDELGKEITNSYFNYYENDKNALNMSVIDLKNVDNLSNYIDEFAKNSNIRNKEFINEISKNRNKIRCFGNGLGENKIGEMADLKSMFLNFYNIKQVNLGEFNEIINKAVEYKKNKGYVEEPCGLSIYLPVNTEVDLTKNFMVYNKDKFRSNYVDFIKLYNQYLLEEDDITTDFKKFTPEFQEKTIKLVLPSEDIKNISAVYLTVYKEFRDNSNIYYFLGTDSDVDINLDGSITAKIDEKFTYINDVLVCTIEKDFKENEYLEVLSPALLNGKEVYLIIKYDYLNSYGSVIGAINFTYDNQAPNRIFEIESGDEIIPLYPMEDEIINFNNISQDKIHDNKYFKGETIKVDEYGLDVNQEVLNNKDYLKYGFIIINSKQEASEIMAIEK